MNKLYSVRIQGFEFQVLLEISDEQLENLKNGKTVTCIRHNTKTGEKEYFAFNALGLISLQETKVKENDTTA